jgi:hypothetical protein
MFCPVTTENHRKHSRDRGSHVVRFAEASKRGNSGDLTVTGER